MLNKTERRAGWRLRPARQGRADHHITKTKTHTQNNLPRVDPFIHPSVHPSTHPISPSFPPSQSFPTIGSLLVLLPALSPPPPHLLEPVPFLLKRLRACVFNRRARVSVTSRRGAHSRLARSCVPTNPQHSSSLQSGWSTNRAFNQPPTRHAPGRRKSGTAMANPRVMIAPTGRTQPVVCGWLVG